MIKNFVIYNEIFRLIDTINPIKKRDEFLGKLMDFYFKEQKPKFEPNSYEETIWLNISKPIIAYKSKVVNGSKGGRPKKTETKTENESKTQSKIKTTSDVDVDVFVNNNVLEKIGCGEEKPLNIYEFIENNFGRLLSPIEYETINHWKSEYEEEIIKYAVRKSVLGNVKTFAYTDGILKNWKSCGYKTLQEIIDNNKKTKEFECMKEPIIEERTEDERREIEAIENGTYRA